MTRRAVHVVLVSVVMVTGLMASSAGASAGGAQQSYIVVLEPGTRNVPQVATDLARAHGGKVGFVYEHALEGFSATISAQGAAALARNPRVAYVNENRAVWAFAESVPTGVSRIDGLAAHTGGATGKGTRVAIIDTGIDSDHPDLQGNLDWLSGYNCISPGASPEDDQGHGTHVAGTVAAERGNDTGVVGVAPEATLIPIKVLDSSGSGTWEQVICGIDRVAALNAVGTKVHVANMSLGGPGTHDGTSCTAPGPDAMYQAICRAIASGTTFVVAAGNDARDASGFVPAAYPEVVTVSAFSDTNGSKSNAGCTGRGPFRTCDEVFASFSNYGSIVDVIAPGVNINSTTIGGGYGTKSGTSMASPHAAGVAALVLSMQPGLSPAGVAAHLRATGQCPDGNENTGTGNCPGTWSGDPDGVTEPMVNASYATASSGGGGGGGEPTNQPPTASFTASCTGLTCAFTDTSTDSDGSVASWSWNFGGGATSTAQNPSHTYAAGGTYTVSLTVTDEDGATGSTSQSVTVTAPSTGLTFTGSSTSQGSTWSAIVTVTGGPTDTTISGTWSIGGTPNSCTTNGTGSCTITRSGIPKRTGSATWTHTDSGTKVTIAKP